MHYARERFCRRTVYRFLPVRLHNILCYNRKSVDLNKKARRKNPPYFYLLLYQYINILLVSEVSFEQTLESPAVAGFVASHFVNGVVNGVEI